MYKKFVKKLNNTFKICKHGQKGITGLETAIILIAFVTVASVLGYSVLSAGIFSSERGKETVYAGLQQAKASMQVRGSVYAMDTDLDTEISGNTTKTVDSIQFTLASVLSDESVDFGNVHINYSDNAVALTDVHFSTTLIGGNVVATSPVLGPNEQMVVSIAASDLPGATITAYDTFKLQILPVTGASITIQRTMPGDIKAVNDLF
jgi:archaeal flagellin FlaB